MAKSNEDLDSSNQKVAQLEADKKEITEDLQSKLAELKTKYKNVATENEKLRKYVEAYKKKYTESTNSIEALKSQLSKSISDAAQQLKESNEKLETQSSNNKKTEEKMKYQNKKLLNSLNNLRSALGLEKINNENKDELKDDLSKEAVSKVQQIIEKSTNSSNQLNSIRKSLGIPENEQGSFSLRIT